LSNRSAGVLDWCARFAQRALAPHCLLCGAPAMRSRLCAPCAASLPRLRSLRCSICALPLTSGSVCGACLERPPAYDSVSAPFLYAFPVEALAGISPARVDALLPVPLAAGRLRKRGFNQARELARIAGRKLDVPVLAHACRKVADTPPQAALPWKERARNVRATFVCDADLTGMRVAIVDDVMTSGATLDELARNLKRAGAVHVSAWVIARTPRV
jgi:ComF family protein